MGGRKAVRTEWSANLNLATFHPQYIVVGFDIYFSPGKLQKERACITMGKYIMNRDYVYEGIAYVLIRKPKGKNHSGCLLPKLVHKQ